MFNNTMTKMEGHEEMLKLPLVLPIAVAILSYVACETPNSPTNSSAGPQQQTIDVQLEELKRSKFCTDAAEKFWGRHGWKDQQDIQNIATYTSHYNKALNKCLVDVHGVALIKDQGQVMESDHVYDAFEDTVIGGRVLLREGGIEGKIQTVSFVKDGHMVPKQEIRLVQPWFDTLMTQ